MINKKGLWFVSLFSLILVLSIYYITMPSELLLSTSNYIKKDDIEVKEGNLITALKVENDDKVEKEMNDLRLVLNDETASIDAKNKAFDKLKQINLVRAEEEELEKLIKINYNLDSYIKIDNKNINVIALKENHDVSLANSIMRDIQSNYDESKYIVVKFQN